MPALRRQDVGILMLEHSEEHVMQDPADLRAVVSACLTQNISACLTHNHISQTIPLKLICSQGRSKLSI